MKKSTILAVVVAVLMAVPLTLYASHQFQDVPNSHTFHTAIDFMAANGITQGCNPPTNTNYCPDDPVTRGQMAGFLKRFHDTFITGGGIGLGFAFRDGAAPPDGGSGVVERLAMNLQIPTAGVLLVTGSIRMTNEVEQDVASCGINFGTPTNTAESDSIRSMDLSFSLFETCSTATAVGVAPGTQLVRVVTAGALPSTQALEGNLTAVLYTVGNAFALASPLDAVEFPEISDEPKDVG